MPHKGEPESPNQIKGGGGGYQLNNPHEHPPISFGVGVRNPTAVACHSVYGGSDKVRPPFE
jgi:hypothetical protein